MIIIDLFIDSHSLADFILVELHLNKTAVRILAKLMSSIDNDLATDYISGMATNIVKSMAF